LTEAGPREYQAFSIRRSVLETFGRRGGTSYYYHDKDAPSPTEHVSAYALIFLCVGVLLYGLLVFAADLAVSGLLILG
jgi:hypothetical protein